MRIIALCGVPTFTFWALPNQCNTSSIGTVSTYIIKIFNQSIVDSRFIVLRPHLHTSHSSHLNVNYRRDGANRLPTIRCKYWYLPDKAYVYSFTDFLNDSCNISNSTHFGNIYMDHAGDDDISASTNLSCSALYDFLLLRSVCTL